MWKSLTKLFPVRSLCKSHSQYWGKRSKCRCHIIKSNVFAITDKNFRCWLSKTFSTRPIRIVHFLHFQFTVVSPEFPMRQQNFFTSSSLQKNSDLPKWQDFSRVQILLRNLILKIFPFIHISWSTLTFLNNGNIPINFLHILNLQHKISTQFSSTTN